MTQENERSRRLIVGLVVGIVFGLGIGLLLGYVIAPVKWVDGAPQDLRVDYAAHYWQLVTQSYSEHGNLELAQRQLGEWNDSERLAAALERAHIESSPEQQQALQTLSNKIVVGAPTPQPTSGATRPAEKEGEGTGLQINWGAFLLTLLLVLLVLVAIGLLVARARKSGAREARLEETGPGEAAGARLDALAEMEIEERGELVSVEPEEALFEGPPLAHMTTTYTQNREYYDEAVGIETSKGAFLGESGIGIVEKLGEDTPDRVTAFEVFLFDKGELRTVTKVLMSEYAYNDEDLRKRLMEKGDLVLAQVGQPIVVETTALRLEATITELVYGTDDFRPNSYFEKLSTELIVRQIGPIVDKMAGPQDLIGS